MSYQARKVQGSLPPLGGGGMDGGWSVGVRRWLTRTPVGTRETGP